MNEPLAALFIAANPNGTDPLRIDRELRVIREALNLARHRERLSFDVRTAATVHDLRRALLDRSYDLVHISGHGEREGLLLEDERGEAVQVPPQALADLFARHSPPVGRLRCVVLNSCWSLSSGEPISMRVPVAIAMDGPISDRGALEFSRGFYDALGAGHDFAPAYGEGKLCVELAAPGALFQSALLMNSNPLAFATKLEDGGTKSLSEDAVRSNLQAAQRAGTAIAFLIWIAASALTATKGSLATFTFTFVVCGWNVLLAWFGCLDGMRLVDAEIRSAYPYLSWAAFAQLAVIVVRCATLAALLYASGDQALAVALWVLTAVQLIGVTAWVPFVRRARRPTEYKSPMTASAMALRSYFSKPHLAREIGLGVALGAAALLCTHAHLQVSATLVFLFAVATNEVILMRWRNERDRQTTPS